MAKLGQPSFHFCQTMSQVGNSLLLTGVLSTVSSQEQK